MSLLVLCVTLVLFTISSTSPLENQRRERDSISDRLKRMQESLQMGKDAKGTVEYERYWRELLANNPGGWFREHLQGKDCDTGLTVSQPNPSSHSSFLNVNL